MEPLELFSTRTREWFADAFEKPTAAQQQAWLATNFFGTNENPNYALTMALVQCFVFLAIILLAAIGPEKHGREF